ncbi:COPIIcoated_ERV domain-containing protein, partial [Cephalotus follicularis]
IIQCKREGFLQRIKDEEGEGCNIYGFLEVNKVVGNFHFAPGKSFQQSNVHVHDLLEFQKDSFNDFKLLPYKLPVTLSHIITYLFMKYMLQISHKINRLAFGDYFPAIVNPLDGVQWIKETPSGMYQYFIKVSGLEVKFCVLNNLHLTTNTFLFSY